MRLEQIIIRPSQNLYLIEYSDNAGRTDRMIVDPTGNAPVVAVVADAQQRLPVEKDRPDKGEIQQEIDELEYRLKQLKKSIGVA